MLIVIKFQWHFDLEQEKITTTYIVVNINKLIFYVCKNLILVYTFITVHISLCTDTIPMYR